MTCLTPHTKLSAADITVQSVQYEYQHDKSQKPSWTAGDTAERPGTSDFEFVSTKMMIQSCKAVYISVIQHPMWHNTTQYDVDTGSDLQSK